MAQGVDLVRDLLQHAVLVPASAILQKGPLLDQVVRKTKTQILRMKSNS